LYYASPIGYRCAGFTHQVSSSCPLNQQFLLLVLCSRYNEKPKYSGITSIRSPPFCVTPSSASLTKLTALLPRSRGDCSYYVSRPTLTPPLLWLQKRTDLLTYAYTIPRTLPTCDMSLGSLTLPASEAEDFVELILLYCRSSDVSGSTCSDFRATRVLCLLTKSRLPPAVGYTVIYCYLLLYTITHVWTLLFLVWCDVVCFVFKCVSEERWW
jgi:hypothetical protein